jgi:hypothetical protein
MTLFEYCYMEKLQGTYEEIWWEWHSYLLNYPFGFLYVAHAAVI